MEPLGKNAQVHSFILSEWRQKNRNSLAFFEKRKLGMLFYVFTKRNSRDGDSIFSVRTSRRSLMLSLFYCH